MRTTQRQKQTDSRNAPHRPLPFAAAFFAGCLSSKILMADPDGAQSAHICGTERIRFMAPSRAPPSLSMLCLRHRNAKLLARPQQPDPSMQRHFAASSCLLIAFSLNAIAHESDCAGIAQDAARLKCYDDVHRTTSPDKTITQQPSAVPASDVPADDSFGMTQRLRKRDTEQAGDTQKTLEAVVVKAAESTSGVLSLTLDNGQRWALLEGHRPGEFEAGDKVNIRKGALDSYRIRNDAGGRILRVRRTQ